MARGRHVVRQFSSGPRRMTQWAGSVDSTTSQTLAAGASVLDQSLSQATLGQLVPATVVRTRGNLWITSDQTSANEQGFGALGMAVVTEQARVAGVGSIPTPITNEANEQWFVWESFLGYFATGQGETWQRYQFDSKAQRKVQEGDAIVVTLENASALFGLEYIIKFRMLLKLH